MKNKVNRCSWSESSPLMIKYHDDEWGTPLHDDRKLFEFLILEGAQAGLSWQTILNKRENYRKAFHNFDPVKISYYKKADTTRLLKNEGIVRNRLKISATITNAQKFLEVKKEFGTFDKYIWQFVGGKTIRNGFKKLNQIPATTKVAEEISCDLKARGFKFVGPTICYAFMQAVGMVDDHVTTCFRHKKVK